RETDVISPFSVWQLGRWVLSLAITGHPARSTSWPAHPIPAAWALPIVLVLAVAVALPRILEDTPVFAAGGAVVAFLLAAPYVLPWYAMSALPALAFRWRSLLTWTAEGLSGLLLGACLLSLTHAALRPIPPVPLRSYVVGFLVADVLLLAALLVAPMATGPRNTAPPLSASPA